MAAHESYSWERKYTAGMNTGMAVDGNLTMGNFLNNSYFAGRSWFCTGKHSWSNDHRW